jgi:hypothetical protein
MAIELFSKKKGSFFWFFRFKKVFLKAENAEKDIFLWSKVKFYEKKHHFCIDFLLFLPLFLLIYIKVSKKKETKERKETVKKGFGN